MYSVGPAEWWERAYKQPYPRTLPGYFKLSETDRVFKARDSVIRVPPRGYWLGYVHIDIVRAHKQVLLPTEVLATCTMHLDGGETLEQQRVLTAYAKDRWPDCDRYCMFDIDHPEYSPQQRLVHMRIELRAPDGTEIGGVCLRPAI